MTIRVKEHYRNVNGKLVLVHEHDADRNAAHHEEHAKVASDFEDIFGHDGESKPEGAKSVDSEFDAIFGGGASDPATEEAAPEPEPEPAEAPAKEPSAPEVGAEAMQEGDERVVNGRTYRVKDGKIRRVAEDGSLEKLEGGKWVPMEARAKPESAPEPEAAEDGPGSMRKRLTLEEFTGSDWERKYAPTYILKDGERVAKIVKWSKTDGSTGYAINSLDEKKRKKGLAGILGGDPNEIIPPCSTVEDAVDKYSMRLYVEEQDAKAKEAEKKARAAKIRDSKRAAAIKSATPANRQEATRAAFDEPVDTPEPPKPEPYEFKPASTPFEMGGVKQDVPDYTGVIPLKITLANRKTILDNPRPSWIPVISDDTFERAEGRIEGVKLGEDRYLICVDRPRGQRMGYYESGDESRKYALMNLASLVATQDYYTKRRQALHDREIDTVRKLHGYTTKIMEWLDKNGGAEGGSRSMDAFRAAEKLKGDQAELDRLAPGLNFENQTKLIASAVREYDSFKSWDRDRLGKTLPQKVKEMDASLDKSARKGRPKTLGHDRMTYSHQDVIARVKPSPNSPPGKFTKGRDEIWREYHEYMKDLKQGSSDMELQMEESASTWAKGRETSYGRTSGVADDLAETHGVLVKRQNGNEITPYEVGEIKDALDSVFSVYGDRSELAKRTGLLISHSGDKFMHASKFAGLYMPGRVAIGVTWGGGQKGAGFTLAHEFAHFMDNQLGLIGGKHHYASDDRTGLENRIASTFRRHMREPQDSAYQNRTCECFARAFEQYFATKTGDHDLYQAVSNSEGNHPTHDDFTKHVQPLIEQFFQERGHILKALQIEAIISH